MTEVEKLILKALQTELEYHELGGYSQWVLGISVQEAEDAQWSHLARTLVNTSDSPYIDGTDILINVDLNAGTAKLNTDDLEAGPIFHGGTETDGLRWLKELAKPCYLQQQNPCTQGDRNDC